MGKKKEKLLMGEAEVFYADPPKCEFTYKNVTVIYKPFLKFRERIDFVHNIAQGCVSDKVFYPSLFDYYVRLVTIKTYTNVTIPTGTKRANNLVYGSGLFEELLKYINPAELNAMIEAAREEIKIMTKTNPLEDLIAHAEIILTKMEEEFSSIDIQQMYKIMDVISASDDKKDMVRRFRNVYINETRE